MPNCYLHWHVTESGYGGAVPRPRQERGCALALSASSYSVLTRLPGDARLAPADAARLLNARFPSPLVLSSSRTRKLPDTLSRLGIAGGAVYDALVALAAKEHGAALATRDARARGTYEAVGVEVVVVT
jgi:toxin FitB